MNIRKEDADLVSFFEFMDSQRELLNIYKGILGILQNLNEAQDAEEVMYMYVEYLKLQVKLSTNYLSFTLNPEGFNFGNCYSYALDLKCPDVFWFKVKEINIKRRFYSSLAWDVGFIAADKNTKLLPRNSSASMLIDNFYRDCEALGVVVYDGSLDDTFPKYNGTIIYMYQNKNIKSNHDFHFVRRNYDGVLSERFGYNGDINSLRNLGEVSRCYELVKVWEIVKPAIRERSL